MYSEVLDVFLSPVVPFTYYDDRARSHTVMVPRLPWGLFGDEPVPDDEGVRKVEWLNFSQQWYFISLRTTNGKLKTTLLKYRVKRFL